ncbi:MAG: CBS domain-containing protein [Thermoflexales bacterium]|nr:CBS domain-containing protein [Thermoflexales bacterium]
MKEGRTVTEAKRFGCYHCTADTLMGEAVRRLVTEDISSLVVTDRDGYLVGVITRADVLRCYLGHDDWTEQRVGDYMSQQVVTVSPDDQLRQVADLLLDKHIHRVIVVREEGGKQKPVAVVSDSDLVYHLMKEVE